MSSWTEADRQYLAELCREHDRMMAEMRQVNGRESAPLTMSWCSRQWKT